MAAIEQDPFELELPSGEPSLTEAQLGFLKKLLNFGDSPCITTEQLDPVARVLFEHGPAIRESLTQSSSQRQREFTGILGLIDTIHPTE